MVIVEHLAKTIGPEQTPVLRDIGFRMESGELIGLLGASGSGKTTLLRCLALRDKWDKGNFRVDGTDILKGGLGGRTKIRREWAFLEQNAELNPTRTALKNVLIGQAAQTPLWRRLTGMVRTDDYMGAMDELERIGLLDKAKMKTGQLSGGERQRVAISRALVHGAKVILADEPVTGLDPKSAQSIMETLRELCKETGLTVVAVLPLELAERYATRLWVLDNGIIKHDVTSRRLTSQERAGLL
ncbi:phosphonate transport system ATP-binding protein [Paenibacillus sophorae]|uniref:ATP-binding cassette domain-containing protein n=1 Tax=Paenibacillus sophorae TaxID=1333845 RepID=A0A1H8FX63_9BACL|nr:ATP-binding cassette domain-containing protein [Paenibacillus sophorae]QWU14008.1 ATP-binding cassette domain-containing protein [Paenibacillus sophorae]SEN36120.1 phosphonate transport system ATP-binding protein [Paenibacillus sophorae]